MSRKSALFVTEQALGLKLKGLPSRGRSSTMVRPVRGNIQVTKTWVVR